MSVGDELLNGETVNTNAAWLGRRLARVGLPVVHHLTVADDPVAIGNALTAAMRVARVVLVSGGLGPTPDDVTREAVADRLGRPLALDHALVDGLTRRFRSQGHRELPTANLAVAHVPKGARVLRNALGTAPGLLMEESDALVVLLPGVPRELQAIFESELAPYFEEWFPGALTPLRHRVLHTTGIPESRVMELLTDDLPAGDGPVRLAFLPQQTGVDLRFTAPGAGASGGESLAEAVASVAAKLRPWIIPSSSGDLAEAVAGSLRGLGLRLAAAESCTGGLIAKRMTDLTGSSDVFLGGVVAYDNSLKVGLLGVSERDLLTHGAVSDVVARQLARGACTRLGADVGVGVTGVAGPGGGSPEKPVGTVWIAVSYGPEVNAVLHHFVGDRDDVRARAAQAALALVLAEVTREGSGA